MANARFLALHNIAPVLPGHALVVPRRHASSILAISDDDFSELFIFARMVTHVLMEVFSADGFDWTIQDGVSAGQTVAHAHIHVIPRHLGDLPDPGDWYPLLVASETRQIDSRHRQRLDPQEHARITTHLKACAERIGAANS